ncbi:MAG: alpha/beta hydrolase [Chloroflexota bacterium]
MTETNLQQYLNAFKAEEHQPFVLAGGEHAALLIHGFPGSPAEMRPIANSLNTAGWTVSVPLLPGFGPQVETLADRKKSEWLDAVQTTYDDLRKQHETVVLIGNSFGAALSIELAATTRQSPDSLVLLSPFWKLSHIAWQAMPVIQLLFPKPKIFKYLNLDFDDPEVRTGIHNFMPGLDLDDPAAQQAIREFPVPVRMFGEIYKAGKAGYHHAPEVHVPVLILQGRHDEISQPHLTKKLASRFSAPVHYYEVNTEHNLTDTEHPDWPLIERYINQFLARLTERPSDRMQI